MWPTSVSESSALRFLKQGSKFITIKLVADGKICCVVPLMFGYNGKETDARTKSYLPFTVGADVTDGGSHHVESSMESAIGSLHSLKYRF
jgi:hypothetical protein